MISKDVKVKTENLGHKDWQIWYLNNKDANMKTTNRGTDLVNVSTTCDS